jgi:small GTP-binding protein
LSVAFDGKGRTLASGSSDNKVRLWELASGKLLRTLKAHRDSVYCVAFDGKGRTLASGSADKTVRLWEAASGKLLCTLKGHGAAVTSVAFDGKGRTLASGSEDNTLRLWEAASGKLLRTLEGLGAFVYSVAFDGKGCTLASGSADKTVRLWEAASGKLLHTLEGHGADVLSVAFDGKGRTLASGSVDKTVRLWEAASGKLLRTLEGHTSYVAAIAFSPDGSLLASKSYDQTVRLWRCDTWEPVAVGPVLTNPRFWLQALAFHPTEPLLATGGSATGTPDVERGRLIHLWELNLATLLGRRAVAIPSMHHTTARIVLVGDSGVGKTGLGWRLAHGDFKEHASTHGQQFWVCNALGTKRRDGTECEAVLWDLAGQPDYRLIHSLFLDDADLALVLFDPTDARDPLHGVEFWLKQLGGERGPACKIVLVAARCDRGDSRLTPEELEAFCRTRGLAGYVRTSAQNGDGIEDLLTRMKTLVDWENKSATTTSDTFKRIKDYVLGLKERGTDSRAIVSAEELRARLEATDAAWRFTDDEMRTAVGHLETYGYVRRLRTSRGERRVLLAPELLNNLAASFVLEARRNPKGLGALEERRLLGDGERYAFPELASLTAEEQTILTDAAALLFIEHHVCFRETDPLTGQSFVIFPELINLKRPVDEEKAPEEAAAYTVSGAVENVFASLVVLLGYTSTFTRIAHWQNNARYEVADGSACGFRLAAERDGELDLTLCFSLAAPRPVRRLFEGLFESCLGRRNLNVARHEPVICGKCGNKLDRAVIRQRLSEKKNFAFCSNCGERLTLATEEPIQHTREDQAKVEQQRRQADARTRFEQAIFRVQAYVTEQKIKPPQCFISYAWGVKEHERWVEKSLATDLQKAGIDVVLDRWENAKIGASVPRFVERVAATDRVIVVGTLLYRKKYDNDEPMRGFVVAAEGDLIGKRMIGAEARKQTVLPALLEGTEETAFPPLLHGRVFASFTEPDNYFPAAFNLILSLYNLAPNHPAVADLVESLQPECGR